MEALKRYKLRLFFKSKRYIFSTFKEFMIKENVLTHYQH